MPQKHLLALFWATAAYVLLWSIAPHLPLASAAVAAEAASARPFATVDGEIISQAEFENFLPQYARSKFYHGTPESSATSLKQEAAEALVMRRLLIREAKRRGILGDSQAVERQMAAYEAKYQGSEAWAQLQPQLPKLRSGLLEASQISLLETDIRDVAEPDEDRLLDYYETHLDSFTEPVRLALAVILIGVPPSSSSEVWEAARQKAQGLFTDLQAGADFSELAKRYSDHESAAKGGDLGTIHEGMLSDPAQKAVAVLGPGQKSAPVRVLEGYTLFQLSKRLPAKVHDFEDVKKRVLALYQRETSVENWNRFVSDLRRKASVVMNVTFSEPTSE